MTDLTIFDCERMAARLSTAGCARMWLSARERPPSPGEGRSACVGCELGARHAGVDIEEAVRAARAQEMTGFCVRCGEGGRRMVRKVHCISCYNRLREARIGRDRRGRAPKFTGALHRVSLVLTGISPSVQRREFPRVTSRPEAIMLAARESGGAAFSVGWQRLAPAPPFAEIEFAPDFGIVLKRPRRRRAPACTVPPPAIASLDQLSFLDA